MHWAWHQNLDLVPTVADEFTLVKGEGEGGMRLKGQREVKGVTASPVFVDSSRGEVAQAFNAAAIKETRMMQ
jgi:hypothetical protein